VNTTVTVPVPAEDGVAIPATSNPTNAN
jgi:hypothetical protein